MNTIEIAPTSGLDFRKETCPCRVCRSDMAYVAPCEFEDAIEFTLIDPSKGVDNEERNHHVQAE